MSEKKAGPSRSDAALARALIGTAALPPGWQTIRALSQQARAYHRLQPYPLYHFRDWKTEDRGPLPRCMPIARSIVRRSARWLFGKPIQIHAAGNPDLERALRYAWSRNRMDSRLVALAERGGLEGGLALKWAYHSAQDPPFSFQSLSLADEVKLYLHPHDRNRILMARVQYPYFDSERNATFWYREEWTDEEEVHYVPVPADSATLGRTRDPDYFTGWTIASRAANPFGIIPVTHIKNIETDDVWGAGDLWDSCAEGDGLYRVLDRIHLTYHLMDRSNQFDSELNPIYIDAEVDGSDIDRPLSPGQPLLLESAAGGPQARVVMPETRGSLRPAMMDYAQDLRKMVLDAASSVQVDPGEITNKGSMTTAVLEQLYLPLISLTQEKRKTYGSCGLCVFLSQAARAAQRAGAELGVTDDPTTSDVQISWPPYFELSEDERAARTERTQEQERAGYLTHGRALARIALMEGIEDIEALQEDLRAGRRE